MAVVPRSSVLIITRRGTSSREDPGTATPENQARIQPRSHTGIPSPSGEANWCTAAGTEVLLSPIVHSRPPASTPVLYKLFGGLEDTGSRL